MKLVILSHTNHYIDKNGIIVGLGSTVREINHLLLVFEEIWHVGVLNNSPAPASSMPYSSDRIHFIPLPPTGGKRLFDKFKIIWMAPFIIWKARNVLKTVDCFQFRAPTGIGVFLIPYLSIFIQKPGWFKYAGNWKHESPPISYRIQQKWLTDFQKRIVTINGNWSKQPKHCLSFENPCISDTERSEGEISCNAKSFAGSLEICFVGRTEEAKGLGKLIRAIKSHPQNTLFKRIHIVGDGPEKANYERSTKTTNIEFIFYGVLSRDKLNEVYKKSNFIILPSYSEGFPKVIAEAANYGVIPIVSNVSSIPQYINKNIGYLWDTKTDFENYFKCIDFNNTKLHSKMSLEVFKMANEFTYSKYNKRIKSEIVSHF